MTAIGDVIQPGRPIPDDVTAFISSGGERATRADHATDTGNPWLSAACQPQCVGHAADEFVHPLTVTAVREPEPTLSERNHAAFIAAGCCGMVAVHMADCPQFDAAKLRAAVYKYAPEPQQIDTSTLLDLVRQYGDEREWVGAYTPDVGTLQREKANTAVGKANALFDRIAALVPHGVVPDGAIGDGPCHDCGAVNIRWYADSPIWNHVMGGPESRDDPGGILCVRCFVVRAFAAGYNPSAWRVSLPVDPLVLSLPEVPEGTVALVGAKTGERWEPYGAPENGWWNGKGGIQSVELSLWELLDFEGSVTVEMAPPREPRTWSKIDGPPKDLPSVRGASGTVYKRWADNSAYYFPPPGPQRRAVFGDAKLLSHWREVDGPLTEVFDNEPGGAA